MKQKREILGIDLLRFAAAFIVMIYHLGFWDFTGTSQLYSRFLNSAEISKLLGPFCSFGFVGVEIFFVISGFVIAYSAETATPFSFFRSRFVRLMPAIWIVATLALPAGFIEHHAEMSTASILAMYARSMLLVPQGPWIVGAMWTLPVEACFYALVFVLIAKKRFDRIGLAASIVGLISTAYWLFYGAVLITGKHHGLATQLENVSNAFYMKYSLISHGCFFALGVILWLVLLKRDYGIHIYMIPLFLVGGCFEIVRSNSIIGLNAHASLYAGTAIMIWLGSVGLLALSVIYQEKIYKMLGRYSGSIRWLGLFTYPLYLVHVPVFLTVIYVLALWRVNQYIIWFSGFFAVLAVAALITTYAEPWLKLRTKSALNILFSRFKRGSATSLSA